jgi:hypothetical protein
MGCKEAVFLIYMNAQFNIHKRLLLQIVVSVFSYNFDKQKNKIEPLKVSGLEL